MLMSKNALQANQQLKIRLIISLVILTFSVLLFVMGMRQNGHGAVERYNRLLAVDQAGGDVEAALDDLRSYIYTHMNAEIGGSNTIYPPIQLKHTYDRLVAAEQARVKEANDVLYSEAQAYCEANGSQSFSGRSRVDCINEYVDLNGIKPQPIEESLYKYDFVAPRWSADLAGFSFIMAVISLLATLLHAGMYLHTRHLVRNAH